MEMLTRAWRNRAQRLRLEGFKITHNNGIVEYEFPPKRKPKILYNSNLFLPNNQIVHCEVVGQNQEQDNKSQN